MADSPNQQTAAAAAQESLPGQGISLGPRSSLPPLVLNPSPLNFANQAANNLADQRRQAAILQGTGTAPFSFAPPPAPSTPNQQAAAQSAQKSVPGTITVAKSNIPGPTSFIGQIPFFLNAVLSTPAGALPKQPLWVIVFEFDENIKNTIKRVKEYEPSMPEKWEIDNALNTVTARRFQEEKGCMFAQAINIPSESLLYSQEGITYNSYIRGGVATGRKDFDPLRISFLNTNLNFVDNVIRPWVIMTGHLGMIARPPSQKYRCNLTLYRLGVNSVDQPPYIAQQFNFWEVCPINVIAENLDYSSSENTPVKEAEFVFQWYTTTSNKYASTIRANQDGQTIARAINPNAPIDVQRPLRLDQPGPFDNL